MPKKLFKKGERLTGRQKGTPNKTTASVKEALEEAFEKNGGVESLCGWAKEQPSEFYKIWAKMLPTEIKTDFGKYFDVVEKLKSAIEKKGKPSE